MTQTLQTLIDQLNHPDISTRSRAVFDIGALDDTDKLDILIGALTTEADLMVREDITWALVRIGERALPPLIALLHDPDPAVRHHATHVLGKLHDARATDALIERLGDESPMVVTKAAVALGQLGDERAVPGLVRLLGTEHRDVESTVNTILEGFGDAAVPLVIGALASDRWQVRVHAADVLGIIGNQDAVPALIPLLQDENWQVRFAVVTALGSLGGVAAAEALPALQADSDARVRELVSRTLRQTKFRRLQRRS